MIQFKDDQTYQLLPIDKNKILVRFENLADRVDNFGVGVAEPWKFDIHQFAMSLYQDVNPNPNIKAPSKIRIEQMDLQGVHPIREVKRFKWLAQGPPVAEQPKEMAQQEDFDTTNSSEVTIHPQQLKTFRITYEPFEK